MERVSQEELLGQAFDQFWESVPAVWNIIRGNLRAIASEQFDISVEQFHVLRLIRKGLTSVSKIAEARLISRPAASQTVDGLVEKGLITRRQAAGDRRFVHLALTPTGEDLLGQIFRQNRAWMMEKMASLSEDDLAAIQTGLLRLKSIFAAPEPKDLQPPAHA